MLRGLVTAGLMLACAPSVRAASTPAQLCSTQEYYCSSSDVLLDTAFAAATGSSCTEDTGAHSSCCRLATEPQVLTNDWARRAGCLVLRQHSRRQRHLPRLPAGEGLVCGRLHAELGRAGPAHAVLLERLSLAGLPGHLQRRPADAHRVLCQLRRLQVRSLAALARQPCRAKADRLLRIQLGRVGAVLSCCKASQQQSLWADALCGVCWRPEPAVHALGALRGHLLDRAGDSLCVLCKPGRLAG